MTTTKWTTPESESTILSTELNSLADGSYSSAGSEIANETDKYLYGAFEIYLASLTPVNNPQVSLYLLYRIDGTNSEDQNEMTCVGTINLSTSTGTKRHTLINVPLAPLDFVPVLKNDAGVALASSGNLVKMSRYNLDNA